MLREKCCNFHSKIEQFCGLEQKITFYLMSDIHCEQQTGISLRHEAVEKFSVSFAN